VAASVGTGPVDAAYRAIDELVRRPATLVDYSVRSVTEGIDALAEVSVRVQSSSSERARPLNPQRHSDEAPSWRGHGADTDIVVASVKAYLAALNRLVAATAGFRVPAVAAEEAVAK
jgi:2-isopropylmalate synthase